MKMLDLPTHLLLPALLGLPKTPQKKALGWAEFWQDHRHTAGQLLPALPGTQETPQKKALGWA